MITSLVALQAAKVLGLAMVAFLIAFAITPLIARFLDAVKARKTIRTSEEAPIFSQFHKHKEGTPTMAGIIIWGTVLGFAGVLFLLSKLFDGFWSYLNFIDRRETYLPLAFMLLAALAGMADDWLGIRRIGGKSGGLKIRHKLIIYTLVAFIGALWFFYKLDWDIIAIPFLGNVAAGWLYIPFFIFIIVASAHSSNLTDGLDGLAGGVLLFAFISLTAVAFVLGKYFLATFGGITIGALLAFLWFNIHPARFFMGDTGSMALGITMGVVALLTNTALLLPFFAPILVIESLSVLLQLASKKFRGKKLFLSTPIHHHFQALGWPESQITMRFWIISAISSAFGLVLFFLSRYF